MAAGLDQYVAQWLTKDHILQVVADPKAAEVVMTDRLGEAFEQKMKQIRPEGDKDKKSEAKKADDAKADDTKTSESKPGELKSNEPAPIHSFRSSKPQGTIFLVDAKTRQVLWSDYQKPPRSKTDRDLNRTAEEIAKKISGPSGK